MNQVVCRQGHPLNGVGWEESVLALWEKIERLEQYIHEMEQARDA